MRAFDVLLLLLLVLLELLDELLVGCWEKEHSDGDRDGQEALRLQNVVERERAKLRALQDISAALGSTLDLGELLEMILDRISEVMEADRSTLYLVDEETDEGTKA